MSLSDSAERQRPAERTVNWLVVGIGDVARKRVLPALSAEPRSRVYGVVTRDAEKGRRHAENVWTELAPALADPAVDAVYIATPVFLHCPQTLAALEAGKHVLCEKPASLTYAEAKEMAATAERAKRLLGIAYFRRCYPKLQRARRLIEQGVIGTPVTAIARCSEWFRNDEGGRDWLLDPSRAGSGPLYDIGSHRIDALNFLFGHPTRVSAHLSTAVHATAVEDGASVLIEYAGGVSALVDARWNTHSNADEFRIEGTEGLLDLTPLSGPRLLSPHGEEMLPSASNRHAPCIGNFVAAVLDGSPLACSAADALPTAWGLEEALRGRCGSRTVTAASQDDIKPQRD
jgi:1,5-anhydro-D-fructose reductase (1,5-anhydro-D-mannitol-forming)